MSNTEQQQSAIERTFDDIPEGKPYDHEQHAAFRSVGATYGITWSDLLRSARILIVSEAGAGKTHECRSQRDKLWADGQPAFYLDLATLARSSVRDMLSPQQIARLDEWQSSQTDVATFFLDSYDELMLSLGKFEQALIRFGKEIDGKLAHVRVIVTTRPIPIDRQLIQEHLPVPPPPAVLPTAEDFARLAMGQARKAKKADDDSPPPAWREVSLLPLSDDQIVAMASHQGVSDTVALMDDIRRRNAQDFARRPQDLIEMCAEWKARHQLVTHREQIAANITVKLKPRDQQDRPERTTLSPAKAFEGASRLALAAALTRQLTFRHSTEADRNAGMDAAIDPAVILYDWTDDERLTLLERPLFGFATYGRVRFHHRSVAEYLAAERLWARLADHVPIAAVKRLLFTETAQGRKVVRPSMRPVAAWLAAVDDRIFAEVLDREPEVLLDYGDPASLQLAQRIEALSGYVARYGSGGWRGRHVPHLQEHRFAAPELADLINSSWAAGVENLEVRLLLLNLIAAGRIAASANVAFTSAGNAPAPRYERLVAIEALIALEDTRLRDVSGSLASEPANWPEDVAAASITTLFPAHMSVAELCQVLRRFEAEPEQSGRLSVVLARIIASDPILPATLDELRHGLHQLIGEGLRWVKEYPHVQVSRAFLAPALLSCCARQLDEGSTTGDLFASIALAVAVPWDEYDRREPRKALIEKLIDAVPAAREQAFWAYDGIRQSLRGKSEPHNRYFEAIHGGPVTPRPPADHVWMEARLANPAAPIDDRRMILRGLLSYVGYDGLTIQQIGERLRGFVADAPELTHLIDEWLKPAPQSRQLRRSMVMQKRRAQQAERRKLKDHASWLVFQKEIAEQPDFAFADEREYSTAWNIWRVMSLARNDGRRETAWNRQLIEQHFNKATADRLRLVLMRAWRNDQPTLVSERIDEQKSTTLVRWQLGLAALTAEAEDPAWSTKLNPDEARLAARYAPIELNAFPSWLGALIIAHPGPVDDVLGAELTRELEGEPMAGSYSMTLQNISYAADEVAASFAPRLRAWLDSQPVGLSNNHDHTAAEQRLRYVLRILGKIGGEETAEHIRSLAAARLADEHDVFKQLWLPTLFGLDAAAGVAALESICAGVTDKQAEGWVALLFGDMRGSPVNLKDGRFTPDLLLRLAKLAYSRVPMETDVQHNGPYTPDTRDDAERGRSNIFGALYDAEGPEAWAAKMALAADPALSAIKDRALTLAEESAAAEADGEAHTVQQVVAFEHYGESPPADRDGMFQIMRDRLDDLDDLLLRDDSPREAWALIEDERIMRRAITFVLNERLNGAFTVDQEAATADEKETDIRLRSIVTTHQAVIELKLGDKDRSGVELRTTIREQLVRKYMAASTSHAGCLLITLKADKQWRHPDTNALLDFAGLIEMLQNEADAVMMELGGQVRLLVKGLDLRPRLSRERGS